MMANRLGNDGQRRPSCFSTSRAEVCPLTFVRTKLLIERMEPGQTAEIRLKGAEPLANVPRAVAGLGHPVLGCSRTPRRGPHACPPPANSQRAAGSGHAAGVVTRRPPAAVRRRPPAVVPVVAAAPADGPKAGARHRASVRRGYRHRPRETSGARRAPLPLAMAARSRPRHSRSGGSRGPHASVSTSLSSGDRPGRGRSRAAAVCRRGDQGEAARRPRKASIRRLWIANRELPAA